MICVGKVKLPGVLNLPLLHLVDDHPVLAGHHHLPHISLSNLEGNLYRNQLSQSCHRYLPSNWYHLNSASATQARQHRCLPQRHILQRTIRINYRAGVQSCSIIKPKFGLTCKARGRFRCVVARYWNGIAYDCCRKCYSKSSKTQAKTTIQRLHVE